MFTTVDLPPNFHPAVGRVFWVDTLSSGGRVTGRAAEISHIGADRPVAVGTSVAANAVGVW